MAEVDYPYAALLDVRCTRATGRAVVLMVETASIAPAGDA